MNVDRAMNAAGLALGSITAIPQLYKSIISSYESYTRAQDIGHEGLVFQAKLSVQAAKLKIWAFHWGIHDGSFARNRQFIAFEGVVVGSLQVIKEIIARLETIDQANFRGLATALNTRSLSINPAAASQTEPSSGIMLDRGFRSKESYADQASMIHKDATLQERLRWIMTDQRAATELFTDLDYLLQGLFAIFPLPEKPGYVQAVWTDFLHTTDAEGLDVLAKVATEAGSHELASASELRSLSLTLEWRAKFLASVVSDDDLQVSEKNIQIVQHYGNYALGFYGPQAILRERSPASSMRSLTTVLVEWKRYDPLRPVSETQRIQSRIRSLALLLRKTRKPSGLRTLDFLGYFNDIENRTGPETARYGFIYRLPGNSNSDANGDSAKQTGTLSDHKPVSLLQILENRHFRPSLGDRFRLAEKIAGTLMILHQASWVHKSLRADNIFFFPISPSRDELPTDRSPPSSSREHAIESPYICGFEYARESTEDASSERPGTNFEHDIYRHPAVQGSPQSHSIFQPEHDLYSLGMILIEIGLWAPLATLLRKRVIVKGRDDQTATKEEVARAVEQLEKGLGHHMGNRYRAVVGWLLHGHGGAQEEKANRIRRMYIDVVNVLSTCQV